MIEWLKDHLPVTRRRHHAEMEWQREMIRSETAAQTSTLLMETGRQNEEIRVGMERQKEEIRVGMERQKEELQALRERLLYGKSCQPNGVRPLVVLFGAGRCGREALGFFGQDTVLCFVDNMFDSWGHRIQEKTIISPLELLQLYFLFSKQTEKRNGTKQDSTDLSDLVKSLIDSYHFSDETAVRLDVVIAITNPGAMRSVAE